MNAALRLYLKSEVDKAVRANCHPPKGNPKWGASPGEPLRHCGVIGIRGRRVPRHMTLDELEGGAAQ